MPKTIKPCCADCFHARVVVIAAVDGGLPLAGVLSSPIIPPDAHWHCACEPRQNGKRHGGALVWVPRLRRWSSSALLTRRKCPNFDSMDG